MDTQYHYHKMKYFLDKYLLKYEVHTCYLDLDLEAVEVEVPTYIPTCTAV